MQRIVATEQIFEAADLHIRGDRKGADCIVSGDHNIISGPRCKVFGDHNVMLGANSSAEGNYNKLEGANSHATGSYNQLPIIAPTEDDLRHDTPQQAGSTRGCVICMVNQAICVALPCGHLSYCVQCSRNMCVVREDDGQGEEWDYCVDNGDCLMDDGERHLRIPMT